MLRYDTLIDFDGVIYDTEERIVKMKSERPDISWNEFFDQLDWYQLLEESNNSVKEAIVMELLKTDLKDSQAKLKAADGHIAQAIL